MDVIIGRYKARMEEAGLLLKHPSGIQFDLTIDETLILLNFVSSYKETLLTMLAEERHTDTQIKPVSLERDRIRQRQTKRQLER